MEPLKKGVNGQKGIEENLGHSRIQPALLLTSSQANSHFLLPSPGPLGPSPLAEAPIQATAELVLQRVSI